MSTKQKPALKPQGKWNDTEFDIPKFSYKSAFLIFGVTFVLTLLVVWLTDGARQPIIFTLSASMALTTGASRYFIDTKKGLCKGFYMTAGILFAACFIILQFVQF